MPRTLVHALTAALCVLAAGTVHARQPGPALAPTTVKDLYYGEVLFHYFQEDYFGALTRLRYAQEKDRVSHHAQEAELLLGGLYLSYGQHLEAGRIFERLLAGNVAPSVRDRAWFYLGKLWYQRGYWQQAEQALREVGRPSGDPRRDRVLSPAMELELRNLQAQVLIHQRRYDDAIARLSGSHGPADWNAYAQFNLGVALVRAGRLEEGASMLGAVGQIDATGEELLSLKDKANVALGYAYLQADKPALAIPPLQRVRLEGPQSNKALLAFGWAESAQKRYTEALVPWMELRNRNLLDAAVQESLLAIPYAFAQLDAHAQAVEHYQAAVRSYEEESARIDESIAAIRAGRLLDAMLQEEKKTGPQPGPWKLENVARAPQSRYLYHLLARHEFQEGLKNHRDLGFMRANLAQWSNSVEAFDDMLDARRLSYDRKLPAVNQILASDGPDQLARRRVDLESQLNAAERSEDVVALATLPEQRMWAQIKSLEDRLAQSSDPQTRDKLRLLKGVLYWQMNEGFKARLWSARRAIKQTDAALAEMQRRWLRVQAGKNEAPQDSSVFAGRIEALGSRLRSLEDRIAAAQRSQGDYLAALAIDELQSQKQRLVNYQLQARYALAAIYDRASTMESNP